MQNKHMRTLTGPLFLSIIVGSIRILMEKDNLKAIIRNLRLLLDALESEVYSDPSAYMDKRENFDDEYYPLADYDEVFEDDDN